MAKNAGYPKVEWKIQNTKLDVTLNKKEFEPAAKRALERLIYKNFSPKEIRVYASSNKKDLLAMFDAFKKITVIPKLAEDREDLMSLGACIKKLGLNDGNFLVLSSGPSFVPAVFLYLGEKELDEKSVGRLCLVFSQTDLYEKGIFPNAIREMEKKYNTDKMLDTDMQSSQIISWLHHRVSTAMSVSLAFSAGFEKEISEFFLAEYEKHFETFLGKDKTLLKESYVESCCEYFHLFLIYTALGKNKRFGAILQKMRPLLHSELTPGKIEQLENAAVYIQLAGVMDKQKDAEYYSSLAYDTLFDVLKRGA